MSLFPDLPPAAAILYRPPNLPFCISFSRKVEPAGDHSVVYQSPYFQGLAGDFSFLCVKLMIMIAAADFNITRAGRSKLSDISLENIPFGKYFTDHMLEVDYIGGEWKNVEIKPYQPLQLAPSIAALHYGQAIFEGIKAYKDENGKSAIFRPHDNFKRFNISAQRMEMPVVPEEIFI